MSNFNAGIVTYSAEAYNDISNFILKNYQDKQRLGDIIRTNKIDKIQSFVWENMMEKFIKQIMTY